MGESGRPTGVAVGEDLRRADRGGTGRAGASGGGPGARTRCRTAVSLVHPHHLRSKEQENE
ncbi:hypothetical protein GCM10023083_58300 [Streptomyces phyllanthi]